MLSQELRKREGSPFTSPWLYVTFVVTLLLSPLLFWISLVIGAPTVVAGALWGRRSVTAIGLGLILGGLPYPLLGFVQNI